MVREIGIKGASLVLALASFAACTREANVEMELFYPGEVGQSELPDNAISAQDPNVHIRMTAPHCYKLSLEQGWAEACGARIVAVDIAFRFRHYKTWEYRVHIPEARGLREHESCETRLWFVVTLVPRAGSRPPRTVEQGIVIHVFP